MTLIIMRTSLCALERQKGRTYVPGVCNYGYAPLSQIFIYPRSRKLRFYCPAMFKMAGSAATALDLFCWLRHFYNRWMDDLRFYALFNSISVISGRCLDDNERLCAMELRLWFRRFYLE